MPSVGSEFPNRLSRSLRRSLWTRRQRSWQCLSCRTVGCSSSRFPMSLRLGRLLWLWCRTGKQHWLCLGGLCLRLWIGIRSLLRRSLLILVPHLISCKFLKINIILSLILPNLIFFFLYFQVFFIYLILYF